MSAGDSRSRRPAIAAEPALVLGVMSGTSIDSVDYALCEVGEEHIRLHDYWQVKFPRELQRRLHEAARGTAGSHELARLHHDLGRFYAQAAVRGSAPLKPSLRTRHTWSEMSSTIASGSTTECST